MGFKIPNDPTAGVGAATYGGQGEVDAGDVDVLAAGVNGTGVESGCAVTPFSSGASLNVNVAAGVIRVQSAAVAVTAVSSLGIGASGASDRVDLVVVSSAGTVSVVAGTAAAAPDYAALTFDGNANLNQTVLAAVWVPANATSITAANIVDKRVMRNVKTPMSRLFARANYR